MTPVHFERDAKFWADWERNWLLYGTVYAINNPEPRVVPLDEFVVMTAAHAYQLAQQLRKAEERVAVLTEAHNAEWALRFAEDWPRTSKAYHDVQDRWDAAQKAARAALGRRREGSNAFAEHHSETDSASGRGGDASPRSSRGRRCRWPGLPCPRTGHVRPVRRWLEVRRGRHRNVDSRRRRAHPGPC